MSHITASIIKACHPISGPTDPPMPELLDHAQMVGFGENPHWVREYHPIILDVLEWYLRLSQTVLLLLESEHWLTSYCERYLAGIDDEFLNITVHDPRTSILYGESDLAFYQGLRALSARHPGRLSCRHIDFNMTGYGGEREAMARAVDAGKWETGAEIRRLQKENKANEVAEMREDFLFQESTAAIRQCQPDRIVFLGGAFHAGKAGGAPFGSFTLQSLFARLIEFFHYPHASVSFLPLTGECATQDFKPGSMKRVPVDFKELWCPFGELGPQIIDAVEPLTGEQFILETRGWTVPSEYERDYADLTSNFDYLHVLRRVTPDMPIAPV